MYALVLNLFGRCSEFKETYFAENVKIQQLILKQSFPDDFIYQKSLNKNIVIGINKIEPAIFKIVGFDISTTKRIWQLPFLGEIIGQTDSYLLVYEEKTSSVHFINIEDGKVARTISPAPTPISSKTGMEIGMAFTNDYYLTTKALYTQVIKNGKLDESFKIGISAKAWNNDTIKWFLPPVIQITNICYRPIIKDGKVLIINAEQAVNKGFSYQIVSLEDGKELYSSTTASTFLWLSDEFFIEQNKSYIASLNPFTQQENWRIYGDFSKSKISSIGSQITIATSYSTDKRNIKVVDAHFGKLLKNIDLPNLQNTVLDAVYFTLDNLVLLHFKKENFKAIATYEYDYWVNYDIKSKKPIWRTDLHSESLTSLFPLLIDTNKK